MNIYVTKISFLKFKIIDEFVLEMINVILWSCFQMFPSSQHIMNLKIGANRSN